MEFCPSLLLSGQEVLCHGSMGLMAETSSFPAPLWHALMGPACWVLAVPGEGQQPLNLQWAACACPHPIHKSGEHVPSCSPGNAHSSREPAPSPTLQMSSLQLHSAPHDSWKPGFLVITYGKEMKAAFKRWGSLRKNFP